MATDLNNFNRQYDSWSQELGAPEQQFMQQYRQSNPVFTQNQMESFQNFPGGFLQSLGYGTPTAQKPVMQETSSENLWNTPPSGGANIVQPGTEQQTAQTQQPTPSWATQTFIGTDGVNLYKHPNGMTYRWDAESNTFIPYGNAQQSTPQVYGGYGAWGQSGLGWNTPGSFNVSGGLNNVLQGQSPGIQPTQPGATGQTGAQGQGFDLNGLLQALQGQNYLGGMQTGLTGLGQQQTTGFQGVNKNLYDMMNTLRGDISSKDVSYTGPSSIGYQGPSSIGMNDLLSQLVQNGGVGYSGPSSIDLTKDLSTMLGVQPGQLGTSLSGLPAGVLSAIQQNPQFAQLLGLTQQGGLLGTGAGSLGAGQTDISNSLKQFFGPQGTATQSLKDILSGLSTSGALGQQIGGLDLGYKGPSATDISGGVQSALNPDIQSILSNLGGLGGGQTDILGKLTGLGTGVEGLVTRLDNEFGTIPEEIKKALGEYLTYGDELGGGTQPPGGTGTTEQGIPRDLALKLGIPLEIGGEAGRAKQSLLSILAREGTEGENADADEINAVVQSLLGLESIPQQRFFRENLPPTFQSIEDIFNVLAQNMRGTEVSKVLEGVNAPSATGASGLQDVNTRLGGLQNSYRMDIENQFKQQENELESSLAARGIGNSSIADSERRQLQEAKQRALAAADMQFFQLAGNERRSDLTTAQGMESQAFTDALTKALQGENIYSSRTQSAQQPLAMLLSSLSGLNVAPQAISQLQMPQSSGGGFLGALGGILGAGAGSFLGPVGTAAGGALGNKLFS